MAADVDPDGNNTVMNSTDSMDSEPPDTNLTVEGDDDVMGATD